MGAIVGYAPGVYDLFHVGHLNVLRQARQHCDVLVAGVVADEICERPRASGPFVPLAERLEIVRSIGIVVDQCTPRSRPTSSTLDDVRFHRSSRATTGAARPRAAHLEQRLGAVGVEVVYFPYTMHTSSTIAAPWPSRLTWLASVTALAAVPALA